MKKEKGTQQMKRKHDKKKTSLRKTLTKYNGSSQRGKEEENPQIQNTWKITRYLLIYNSLYLYTYKERSLLESLLNCVE
jgi:prenyltransferase beta subunit